MGKQTAPADGITFTVAAGGAATIGPFGIQPNLVVPVAVFNDINGDGILSGTEMTTSGNLFVDLNNNGFAESNEPQGTVNGTSNAFYLPAGTFIIRSTAPNGYRNTGRYVAINTSATTFVADGKIRLPGDLDAGFSTSVSSTCR